METTLEQAPSLPLTQRAVSTEAEGAPDQQTVEDLDPPYAYDPHAPESVHARRVRTIIIWIALFLALIFTSSHLSQLFSATSAKFRNVPELFRELGVTVDIFDALRKRDIKLQYGAISTIIISTGAFCLVIASGWLGRIWNSINARIFAGSKETAKSMVFLGTWKFIGSVLSSFTAVDLGFKVHYTEFFYLPFVFSFLVGLIEGFIFHRAVKNLTKFRALLLLVTIELLLYCSGDMLDTILFIQRARPLRKTNWTKPIFDVAQQESFPSDRLFWLERSKSVYYRGGLVDKYIAFGSPIIDIFPQELAGIMAHELGHHKNKSTLIMLGINSINIVLSKVLAIYAILPAPAYYSAFGFIGQPVIGALPIADIMTALLNQLARPVKLFISRTMEYSADAHTVKLGYGKQFQSFLAQHKLFGLLDKASWYEICSMTRPTSAKRINYIESLNKESGKEKNKEKPVLKNDKPVESAPLNQSFSPKLASNKEKPTEQPLPNKPASQKIALNKEKPTEQPASNNGTKTENSFPNKPASPRLASNKGKKTVKPSPNKPVSQKIASNEEKTAEKPSPNESTSQKIASNKEKSISKGKDEKK